MPAMNRRTFIGSSFAAATLSASAKSWANLASHSGAPADTGRRASPIGLQLYTVRAMMKTDMASTLAKVATVGYKEVEMAGYFDHAPKDVRAMLDENGLTSPSSHVDYKVVEKSLSAAIDSAHTMGQTFLICPSIDDSQRKEPDGYKRAAELFNRAGGECQKAGIQFGYHNHTAEFTPLETLGATLPYDYLLKNTDPKLVCMEMDLCWITVAGQDPLTYFAKYPARFPLVHVKDWQGQGGATADEATRMRNVGQGSIDFKRIFAQSGEAGIKHYFVENDAAKSIEDIQISYKYLSDLRF
jgi:sugar phosphate isomerase/epimerase